MLADEPIRRRRSVDGVFDPERIEDAKSLGVGGSIPPCPPFLSR